VGGSVSDNLIELAQNNDSKVDLTTYVSSNIYNCPETSDVLDIQGYIIGAINYYMQYIINQCFISTATDVGLTILEKEFGITTDTTLSIESRRQTLLAKKRSWFDITNEAKIKSIADAYDCDCEIIPYWEESYFVIKFTGLGVPSNLEAFKAVISQIKPAHLGVEYEFTYELWSEVNNGFTWQDVLNNNNTWNDILNQPLRTNDQIMYSLSEDGTTYNEIKYEISQ
jgi:hypothetical protein